LTNFHPFDARMPGFALVTPTKLEAVLKVSSRDLGFIAPFIWAPAQPSDFLANDLAGQVRDIIVREGLETKRVGLAGAALMPPALQPAITEIFPAGVIDADGLIDTLRRKKSAAERGILRLTATKAEAIVDAVAEHAAAGMTETELAAFADYAARKAGAQDVEFLMHSQHDRMPAAGANESFPFRPPAERALEAHEQLGVFLALQYHGYWAELSQSIFIGGPRPEQKEAYEFCVAAFDELRGRIGRTAKLEGGVTSFWTHGIGLDREEEPSSTDRSAAANDGEMVVAHVAVQRNEARAFFGRTIVSAPAGGTILAAPITKSA
jgi:Xaa-Pro aminopeptidase